MKSRMRAGVGGLCAVLALGGWGAWRHCAKGATTAHATVAGSARPAPRFAWPKGTRAVYSLAWSGDTTADVLPKGGDDATKKAALSFGSTLDADVAIRSFGPRADGNYALGVSLPKVRSFELRSAGQKSEADMDTKLGLQSQEVRIAVDARGVVHQISFPSEMDPKVRSMLRNVVEELQVTLPAADVETWGATEMDPTGVADVTYDRAADDDQTIARRRVRYTSLAAFPSGPLTGSEAIGGGDTIVLDGHGGLKSLQRKGVLSYKRPDETQESLHAVSSFTLERKETTRFDGEEPPAALDSQSLAANVADKGAQARMDAQLAEGLSGESMLASIVAFSGSGHLPKNFTTRAGAYLRLHPEQCAKLLAPFVDPTTNAKGKGLLLDVLTAAGSHEAQDVMRKALATPAAHEDANEYALLVQRFSFLRAPDAASVGYVRDRLQASSGAARGGEAAALGSMVRHLGRDDGALAAACDGALRDGLAKAKAPEDKQAYILGLGNARTAEDESAIAQMASDDSPNVRAQVATSLNWYDNPDSRLTLMTLSADSDGAVAREAILSLGSQTLDENDWAVLSSRVSNGETPASLDSAYLALVTRQLGSSGADGAAILQQIVAREEGVGDVAARARQLLALNK